jgi:hypothetical protein
MTTPLKQVLFTQQYSDHYTETAIEPIKVFGSKRYHGAELVCRKLVKKDGYVMDYGPITITCKRLFDAPRIAGSQICIKEFEFAAQQIKKELGIA